MKMKKIILNMNKIYPIEILMQIFNKYLQTMLISLNLLEKIKKYHLKNHKEYKIKVKMDRQIILFISIKMTNKS